MKKLFSWGKVLPLLGVSVLAAGAIAFAASNSSSAHDNRHNDSARYTLTLVTEAEAETPEATEATPTEEETGTETKIELSSYRFLEDEPEAPSEEEAATLASDFGNNNLRFQADSSMASPLLFEKANTGEVIPEATLVVKEGKWSKETMTFNMTNLVVTSYQNTAAQSEEDKGPQDIVVMSYETLEIVQDEGDDKTWKEGWNFKHDKEM